MAARRRIVSGIDRTVSGREIHRRAARNRSRTDRKVLRAYFPPGAALHAVDSAKRSRRSGRLVRRYDRDPVVRLPLRPLGIHRRRFRRRDTQYAGSGHLWTAAGFRTPLREIQGGTRSGDAARCGEYRLGGRTGTMVRRPARQSGRHGTQRNDLQGVCIAAQRSYRPDHGRNLQIKISCTIFVAQIRF